jgi:ATP-dependent helicase/nuclease subunit A
VLLPPWLSQSVAAAPAAAPIRPSGFVDEREVQSLLGPREARQRALQRGTIMHRLMQSLPDVPPERRADAARRYLDRAARDPTKNSTKDFTGSERARMAAQVLAVLGDPRFAPLFAPGSRAEVSIAGRLTLGGATVEVAGQIDRLVVTPGEVLIADYKTNRPAPQSIADVPPNYVRQLALYRAVLQKLYPDKTVRAALVWTDRPESMELPAAALDGSLLSI